MGIISYKGFDKDLKCRGFQYEIGKEYEMDGDIEVGFRGFHACENPLDVFDYYSMIGSRFCEVELDGRILKGKEGTKICSSRIKIKAELNGADMINIGVKWLKDITSPKTINTNIQDCSYGDNAKIGSSDDDAKIGSSGFVTLISSSGNRAKIGSSGYHAQIGSSGIQANIGSSGNRAKIASSGYGSLIGSSGYGSQIGSSGNSVQIYSSGDDAQIGSSGNHSQIGSSGDRAKIASSGDKTEIDSAGENSVIMCAGENSIAKAKKGSWITLSEWFYSFDERTCIPICVKTEFVDGERIKADTYYKLKGGVFVEVEEP